MTGVLMTAAIDDRRDRPRYEQPRYDDRRRPKKKEGWLGELFDF